MSSTSNRLFTGTDKYPLIQAHAAGDTIAWHNGKAISTEAFLHDVYAVATQLPAGQYAINLCEDRYWFLVGFAALLVQNQTSLLPPNRAIQVIDEIARDYPGTYCLCDSNQPDIKIPVHRLGDVKPEIINDSNPIPLIPGQHLAAIVFTSGSTGKARPNLKYWKDLITGARMKQRRFGFGENGKKQTIVATVPPQHMYGLETTILNLLINGISVYTNKIFFPADIYTALNSVPEPRVLVTTPVHMKSCVDAGLDWPKIDFVVSATAPLEKSLAIRSESVFNCPVLEIYGCSEAGSLASRRTRTEKSWLLYEDTTLKLCADGYCVSGPNLPDDVLLHDVIEPINTREFLLNGRHSDMVNIAGKRASLEDLNIRLRNIEGVHDAAFIIPESTNNTYNKLAALVVAPSLKAAEVRNELALKIDPVFLPRPLYIVEKLPRNETGKLPRTALLDMLNSMRNDN